MRPPTHTPTPLLLALLLLALLLLALAAAAPGRAPLLPPRWEEDPAGEVQTADEQLHDALAKGLHGGGGGGGGGRSSRSAPLQRPVQLPDVYFHDDEQQLTVTADGPAAELPSDWEVRRVEAVLEEQRADLELRLAAVTLTGAYTVDRRAYGDYDSREEGRYTLELLNVTATGVAALHVEGDTVALGRVVLKLEPADQRFEVTRQFAEGTLEQFVLGGGLEAGLRRRLWRDLTLHLEAAARSRLRPALTARPLSALVPDPDVRRRLQAYAEQSTESADEFVDDVLRAARGWVRDMHENRVSVPDIREGFERKVMMMTLRGSFWAGGGSARGLSSAYRSGDATFARENNGSIFHVWGGVAFDDLTVEYERYEAEVMGLGPSGSLSAEVYPLLLHVHVHVDFDKDRVLLDDFRVDDAGDLQVEVSGLGVVLNWLASRIASWVAATYRSEILDALEQRYARYFAESLADTSLSDIANGRAWTDRRGGVPSDADWLP